jgi:dimethylamine/trimethylamine dehydrogenase
VHLIDAQSEVGGSVRRIAAYPHLGEWARVINYRKIQLDRLRNVDVILSRSLSPADVLEYGAEIVVVATGSYWRGDGAHEAPLTPLAGADQEFVFTPEAVSDANGDIPGDRVLIFDADGYFTGVGMAEMLLRRGKAVTVVTPFADLAPYMFFTGEGYRVNRELRASGAEVVTHFELASIAPGRVTGHHAWNEQQHVEWNADAVVLVTKREPRNELYAALVADPDRLAAEEIEAVYRIGDCVAPRLIADCIFDGHRLAREIDSPDPAEPLPYRRESRRLIGESV